LSTTRTLTDLSCSLTTANASNVVSQTRRAEIGFLLGTILAVYSSEAGASSAPYATTLSSVKIASSVAGSYLTFALSNGGTF
jgi:hypothetical protein